MSARCMRCHSRFALTIFSSFSLPIYIARNECARAHMHSHSHSVRWVCVFTFHSQNCYRWNTEIHTFRGHPAFVHFEFFFVLFFLFLNLDHESALKWNSNGTNETNQKTEERNRNDNDNSNPFRVQCSIWFRLLCDRQHTVVHRWPHRACRSIFSNGFLLYIGIRRNYPLSLVGKTQIFQSNWL